MPKICMLVYNNLLHDSRVQKESEALLLAGYQVTILGLLDEETSRNETRRGVKIIRIDAVPWYVRLLRKLRDSISRRRSEEKKFGTGSAGLAGERPKNRKGTLIGIIKRSRHLMFFHLQHCFLSFYCGAYKATAGEKYDIYHAHDLNTLPVAYLTAKRDKAKLIYDSHELYVERNRLDPSSRFWKLVLRRLEGFLARRADAVLTVNEALADIMAKRYGMPQPVVVMNTPARVKQLELVAVGDSLLRSELGISPELELLIYVGKITFNRGLEQLVSSLKILEGCCLVCMGGGDESYKNGVLSIAKKMGVDHRLFFFGPVPSDRVIHFAAGADLGVAAIANACLSYYYCSPNKLFEYMNAGLPVIASDFPELRKVVLTHDIGLTFDPSDPQDIARAARTILKDAEGRERMRRNALKASALYNWEKESLKLLNVYEALSKSACQPRNECWKKL
jgi:glycosyltransferase involved in cell wall biosynthesis